MTASPRGATGNWPPAFDARPDRGDLPGGLNEALDINCPHCGETFSLAFDVSEGSAEFVIDCEVCCRPMKVSVQVGAEGEIEGLDVVEE